jgi:hypothetical protein
VPRLPWVARGTCTTPPFPRGQHNFASPLPMNNRLTDLESPAQPQSNEPLPKTYRPTWSAWVSKKTSRLQLKSRGYPGTAACDLQAEGGIFLTFWTRGPSERFYEPRSPPETWKQTNCACVFVPVFYTSLLFPKKKIEPPKKKKGGGKSDYLRDQAGNRVKLSPHLAPHWPRGGLKPSGGGPGGPTWPLGHLVWWRQSPTARPRHWGWLPCLFHVYDALAGSC